MKKIKISSEQIMALAITFAFLALVFGVFAMPYMGVSRPGMGARDNAIAVKEVNTQQRWDLIEQLNVFNDVDTKGEQIIAPDSSGSYPFTIKNDAKFAVKYTLNVFDENLAEVPMVFRLSTDAGTYLCGSEYLWVPVEGLQNVSGKLDYQATDGYVLEWKWAGDSDEVDTAIGVLAQQGMIYTLNFKISAIQNGPAVGYGIGPVTSGDISIAAPWIAIVFTGFIALFTLLCVSAAERRKLREV